MKKTLAILILALVCALCFGQTAPTTMNFQGRLTRLNGKPLPDGQYVVTIRLWKDLTSTNSNDLLITWQSLSVQVRSGVFSTSLPNLTEAVLAGGVAYLEIEPNGQQALSPRVPVLSVPYAVLAGTVFDGAITNGKLQNDAVTSAKVAGDTMTLSKISNGLIKAGQHVGIGLGSETPGQALDVGGNVLVRGTEWSGGQPSSIYFGDTNHSISGIRGFGLTLSTFEVPIGIVLREFTGNVGVGTSEPTAKLDVYQTGDLSLRLRNESRMAELSLLGDLVQLSFPGSKLALSPNTTPALFIDDLSRVGINTTVPDEQFDVATNAQVRGFLRVMNGIIGCPAITGPDGLAQIKNEAQGEWAIRGGTFKVYGDAIKPGGGPWADLNSDGRLKSEIRPLEDALGRLLTLQGVSYKFKNPEQVGERPGLRRGFIAQEVERAFPEWVITKPDGYKTISFDSGFDALNVEAMRELATKHAGLERRVSSLTSENQMLKARLDRLERLVHKR